MNLKVKKNCICCGAVTSHLDMPLELVCDYILCRECAGNIIYDINKIYKNMPEAEFEQLKNKIIDDCKNRFSQGLIEVIIATVDKKYYESFDMSKVNNIHFSDKNTNDNITHEANGKTLIFNNIGGKIKVLAEVVTWVGIVASVISGIVIMANDEDLMFIGFITALLGSLSSWISSLAFYGFGQLIENTDKIAELSKK